MNYSRQVLLPIDHIVAELAAFPLVSAAAFELASVKLSPMMDNDTALLWRKAEKELLTAFPALSVDEIVSMRDKIWFPQNNAKTIPFHIFLRNLAEMYLEPAGPAAIPRLPTTNRYDEGDESLPIAIVRRSWRWLSLAVPPDLLLAALGNEGTCPEFINLLSPTMDKMLNENGYAETHLHVGAAIDFPALWQGLLLSIAHGSIKEGAFQSPGAEFDDGINLGPWLIRAAIARYVLAAYLFDPNRGPTLLEYLHHKLKRELIQRSRLIDYTLLLRALNDLETRRLSRAYAPFAQLQILYRVIAGFSKRVKSETIADPFALDPINHLAKNCKVSCSSPEIGFVATALKYLAINGSSDRYFSSLFWQVIRLRAIFYRHIVHRPMTPGLQWFVRFYDRMRPAKKIFNNQDMLVSAAHIDGLRRGLRSLEVRTSPEKCVSSAVRYIRELDKVSKLVNYQFPARCRNGIDSDESVEIGLVYHFVKSRGGGAPEGRPNAYWRGSYADPQIREAGQKSNVNGYRYSGFYRKKIKEAQTVEWLLRHYPKTLELIRGVDICTDELGVPNWVLAPILKRIRYAAYDAGVYLKKFYNIQVQRMHTTAHVGEDFIHLLTGLRNVCEVIEQFELREGDRIGHGMSLGIDPEEWSEKECRIPMALEDRLMDLVWEWEWYGRMPECVNPERQIAIEYKIAKISEAIFDKPHPPYELMKLRNDLYDPWMLYKAGFPERPVVREKNGNGRVGLLIRYLTDPNVFIKGRQIIWVRTDNEGKALARLQAGLRKKIGSMGIGVEVNPSSNLLIGDLNDLTSHPMWRLKPPKNDGDAPPVSVCIGSDDPVLFGSNLRHEYQYLADAMIIAGLSDDEAYRWIDEARECGLLRRFTCQRQLGNKALSIFNIGMADRRLPI